MRICGLFFCLLFCSRLSAQLSYRESIAEWDKKRMAELKAPGGWLNVAGLFWLNRGINTFGKDSVNTIIFRNPDFPSELGRFEWSGDTIYWTTAAGHMVHSANKPVQRSVALILNKPGSYTFSFTHYRWNLIQRQDKVALRLRDLNHPALQSVDSIPRYPVDPSWRVNARLIEMPGKELSITNVIGQTIKQPSAGKIEFTLNGKPYSLDAIDEGNNELFIIFGDETNALETYPSGRYIYIEKPGPSGKFLLDFNKAENPPCAFTAFATCPLPPVQNRLPVAIPAGEKDLHYSSLK